MADEIQRDDKIENQQTQAKKDQSPSTNRIEAFSDGVFAIVITLLAFQLESPQIENKRDWYALLIALLNLAPKFLGFVMSFFFVAVFWVAHHQFFHTLNFSRRGLLWLNNLFLFFVTFIAFPTSVLGAYPNNETAVVFFGITYFATSLTFALLRWYGWRKNETASEEFAAASLRKAMHRSFLPPVLYLIGIFVCLYSFAAAIIIYFLTPALLILPLKLKTRSPKKADLEL